MFKKYENQIITVIDGDTEHKVKINSYSNFFRPAIEILSSRKIEKDVDISKEETVILPIIENVQIDDDILNEINNTIKPKPKIKSKK